MEGEQKTGDFRRMTRRQEQILELVAAGLSDKEIASKLGLSARTVQSHLDRFYLENRVHKRAAAVAILMEKRTSRSHDFD